jgi:hypothetical protein
MSAYAQCVLAKYDGTLGLGAPSRSSRTRREMLSRGVLNVACDDDDDGWTVVSQCSARALDIIISSQTHMMPTP